MPRILGRVRANFVWAIAGAIARAIAQTKSGSVRRWCEAELGVRGDARDVRRDAAIPGCHRVAGRRVPQRGVARDGELVGELRTRHAVRDGLLRRRTGLPVRVALDVRARLLARRRAVAALDAGR